MSSTTNKQLKVFIAGISGRLGHQIAEELVNRKSQIQIVGICRSRSQKSQEIQQSLNKLEKQGVKIIEGNVQQPQSYLNELKDVNVIISALKGDRSCIVDTQKNLFENGVKQGSLQMFIPSDYSLDYSRIPKGEVPVLDWRREFSDWVESRKSNVKVIHILNGCFMDTFFSNELGICNMNSSPRVLNFYGSENTNFDLTTTRDAARFTVEAIFDKSPPSKLTISSDTVSFKQIVDTFNKYNGQNSMKLNKLGNIDDLENKVKDVRQKFSSDVSKWTPVSYQLQLVKENRGRLSNIMNDRYSNVKTISLSKFLETEKFSSG